MNFAIWLEASGMPSGDWSHLSLADRMAQGRDVGENFIRRILSHHGVHISQPKGSQIDKRDKIDGFWNNEPVQIKLRKTSGASRTDDIAYEVVRNHDNTLPLVQQLENPAQQGRDWSGRAKHYFILNRPETEIYHVLADDIKTRVLEAVLALGNQPLTQAIEIAGVDLRPTRDNDPQSFTPFKVMAFVKVLPILKGRYPVIDLPKEIPPQALPKGITDAMAELVKTAIENGQASFNKPNNVKILKPLEKYARKRGVDVEVVGNRIILKRAA